MLDLHVRKIIAYLIERVFVSLSFVFSSFLEGVIMEIFSCLVDRFPVRTSYFLLIWLFFYQQVS